MSYWTLRKRRGEKCFNSKEGEFLRDFLFDTGGVDLGCEGGFATWKNSRNSHGRICKHLDRVVADANWCTEFHKARVVKFPILGSDHALICLQTTGEVPKLKYPFRFFGSLDISADCETVIMNAWRRGLYGSPDFQLLGKPKGVKYDLKKWNQEVFGFSDRRLVALRRQLAEIQKESISHASVQREAEVQLEIIEMEGRMDRIWRQKSRENWIRFGDANSKFFHTSTIICRRRNSIGCVEDSHGVWLSDREEIGNYLNKHFSDIFESTGSNIDNEFTTLFEDKVTDAENECIGRILDTEEIKDIIFKMHPVKVLGLDGFPRIFYRKYWDMNPNASRFDHYRPISLCNYSYKVISRILTDRLKGVLDRLISPLQLAFMPGRWIAECSILAQEVLHSIKSKKGKVGAIAIKTDMSKAYDRLEWDFIRQVHQGNSFNTKVCNLIMQCITMISFSVLLNGAPIAPFNPNRGIRQGDPLSPFIFILCSEVLSKLIVRAESNAANVDSLMKCIRKLEGRKARHLAQAGRSVLISSVLQSILNYFMSTVLVPKTLCNDLDRILAKFWWLGISERNRYCALKSRNDICQPKKSGVLGFRRFADMNVALLAKLFLMVLKYDTKVWVRDLRDKYCRLMSPWSVEKKAIDSQCWKSILEARQVCLDGAGLIVVDGGSELWDRPWVPHRNMEELKAHFKFRHYQAFWNIKDLFVDGLRVWNEELIRDCFNPIIADEILRIRPLEEGSDILFWKASKSEFGEWWYDITDGNLSLFAACVCDTIWRWRNDMIHKERVCNLEDIYADCMLRVHKDTRCFRVDASVAREEAGFATVLITGNQMADYLIAANCETGFKMVKVESDSKAVVTAFQAGSIPLCWSVFPLFSKCLKLCKEFVNVEVSYIPRDQNVVADKLAQWARVNSSNCMGLLSEVAPFVATSLL
uniref:Reverse transcriptase n=1 Tax=Cannabis sativa TaxID=3483 RepID=A0A803Q610_CANSA